MTAIDGRVPEGTLETTTGQTNRVWYVPGPRPYVLKHYGDPGRAANEAAALTLLRRPAPAPEPLAARPAEGWTTQSAVDADPVPATRSGAAFRMLYASFSASSSCSRVFTRVLIFSQKTRLHWTARTSASS